MSDASTKKMIQMYVDEAEAPMFLSGFFQSPPGNFHNSEEVEYDIVRDDEDIAVPVQSITAGARENQRNLYTNKKFLPPVFKEAGSVGAFDLMKRAPGMNPFEDPDFAENAAESVFASAKKLDRKVKRSIELMASQVLQTGSLTLVDASGNTIYSLDFQPKSTHFVTAGNDWGTNNATPLDDVADLANVIRRDGRKMPTKLVMGRTALASFIGDTTVQKHFDKTILNRGVLNPETRGVGGVMHGMVTIGQYRYELWSYDGYYKSAAGVLTPYLADDKVLILCDGARFDLTYGGFPTLTAPDPRAMAFIPSRISDGGRGLDLNLNAYFSPNGEHLHFEVKSRPLTIPTAIDTYGCLDTVA